VRKNRHGESGIQGKLALAEGGARKLESVAGHKRRLSGKLKLRRDDAGPNVKPLVPVIGKCGTPRERRP
jgi:hypothetical protein